MKTERPDQEELEQFIRLIADTRGLVGKRKANAFAEFIDLYGAWVTAQWERKEWFKQKLEEYQS